MKRLIILILLITALAACGSTKDADKDVEEESKVKETEVKKDEKEKEEKEEVNESEKEEVNDKEESKDEPVEKEDEKEPEEKPAEKPVEKSTEKPKKKPTEKPKKEPVVKNEKVEVATENIIWAQNDRNYSVLKSYLGQNITLNEKNNTMKITNVDYPQTAELLKGIKKVDLEHRFTHDNGKDQIVGFAAIDHDRDMSYTIEFTMRVGKDSWKMLNMQINK